MRIFIVGVTGGVGSRLARSLQARGDLVSGLVRRAEQRAQLRAAGIDAKVGDLTTITAGRLAELIGEVDAIVYAAGAVGTAADRITAIEGEGVATTIDAARINGIDRLGLVSAFPEAWRERNIVGTFEHYMAVKKRADVALARSALDWVILRPSALLDEPGQGTVALGPAQIHEDISRDDVADTLAALLHEPRITRQILEVTSGSTPIADAIAANVPTR